MRKITIFSLFLMMGFYLKAQEVSMTENIRKSFWVDDNAEVEIENKYGEIIVNTWYKDSVRFVVTIEAKGKDRKSVAKALKRAEVELRKYGNKVLAKTDFVSSRSGILGDFLDQASEASKTITGNYKLEVNYELWMPEDLRLRIVNKFGDIYLSSLKNKVDIDMSYGDLRGNNCESELMLKHSFGKHSFDFVNTGIIELRKAESSIAVANTLEYKSTTSEIDLGKVTNLKINSRNDNYEIDEAVKLTGQGSFTDLRLDFGMETLILDFDYGEIFVSGINKDFKDVLLTGKSTDMNLILDQASYIDTEIKGQEERMILPNSMLLLNKEMIAEEDKIKLKGYVGNTNTTHGNLKVDASSGDLIISIKETSTFTNKE
jgi:hypothetical protein